METSGILRQAYTSNGLSIDGGGTFSLPRLVGLAKALEIAAFDRPIDAEKAYEWGLVTEFEGQMEKERDLLSWCADQPNGREGIAAFLEKRRPVFNK
jgi:2-(1,2-epoxy-1,2-dihydrophenyl)acetyl-CoA isomerase